MQFNLTVESDVKEYMSQATSEDDYNSRCDAVKAANNGYPSFWFAAIVLSGLASLTKSKWS